MTPSGILAVGQTLAWKGIDHRGLNNARDFRQSLFGRYAAAFLQGITDGSDEDVTNLNSRSRDYRILSQIRRNVLAFALAKVKTVESESNPSNRNATLSRHRKYAEAEYNLITAGTQMAQKWGDITDRAGALPWLQYDALNDDRTRPDHLVLDGVTLPVSDPFWNNWLPPNGWNCRCTVRQLAQAERVEAPALPNDTETPPYLRHNPGMSGIIFGESHGYFRQAGTATEVRNAAADLVLFDLIYTSASGAKVIEHAFADTNRVRKQQNITTAQLLADNNLSVRILSYKDLDGVKNPDISVGGIAADFKTVSGKITTGIQNGAKSAAKQNATKCIVNLDTAYDKNLTKRGVINAFMPGRNKKLLEIYLIINKKVYRAERSRMTEKDYLDKLLP